MKPALQHQPENLKPNLQYCNVLKKFRWMDKIQTQIRLLHLIWVSTVFSGMSSAIFRIITAQFHLWRVPDKVRNMFYQILKQFLMILYQNIFCGMSAEPLAGGLNEGPQFLLLRNVKKFPRNITKNISYLKPIQVFWFVYSLPQKLVVYCLIWKAVDWYNKSE